MSSTATNLDINLEQRTELLQETGGQTYVEQKPDCLQLADGHKIKEKRKDDLNWVHKNNAIRNKNRLVQLLLLLSLTGPGLFRSIQQRRKHIRQIAGTERSFFYEKTQDGR
jgi:hypothetical protein